MGGQLSCLDVLLDPREARKADPWSIDLAEALPRALEELEANGRLNFALAGLVLLCSCIIYEQKAMSLLALDGEGASDEGRGPEGAGGGQGAALHPLLHPIAGRLRPRIDFLSLVISILMGVRPAGAVRRPRRAREESPAAHALPEPGEPVDIAEWKERVLAILRARGPCLPLEDLLAVFRDREAMLAFLAVLHLAQEGALAVCRRDGRVLLVWPQNR